MLESPASIFENPVARAKLADLAKLGDEMTAKKRAKRRVPEAAVIDVGLLKATF
jgi:antitoxin component of MazEF toxin-antitoxin module